MVSFFFVFNYSDNICGYVSNMYYDKHQEDDLDNANLTRIEHDDVVAVFETENTPLPRENKYGNLDEIVARGEVVVCAKKDDNNALFQVKTEDGRYVGKDVEFAKTLASELGVRLRYRMIYPTYDDVIQAVQNGEGDIGIAKISYTPARSLKIMYTEPYVISRHVFLINRVALEKHRDYSIQRLLNDKGTKIGVTANTAYESFVKDLFPKSEMVTDDDWENIIVKKVAENELTATIRDEVRIKSLLKRNPMAFVKIIPIAMKGEHETMSAVIRRGNFEFLHWCNRFLEAKMPPENVNDLMEKYGDTIK